MEYFSIFVKGIFVENMIFAYFLGMCSYLAISKTVKTSVGMGAAVIFVLAVTVPLNWLLDQYLLQEGALAWLDPKYGVDGSETLDLTAIKKFWSGWFDKGSWPVEDLFYSLANKFVRRVVMDDPAAMEKIQGKSVLYLANHQVGIESLLFSIIVFLTD